MEWPIILTSSRFLDAPHSTYPRHSYFRRFLKFTPEIPPPTPRFVEHREDVIAFDIAMSPGRYRPYLLREEIRSKYGIHVKVPRYLSNRDLLDIYGAINMTPRRHSRRCRNCRRFPPPRPF